MIRLEKITSSLFPSIYDAFLFDDDPLSSEQDWRNVFDYAWETSEGHCGYALLDDDTVIGMMGMVFSERLIDGDRHRFCNLHTWWVREDHRGRSLSLLRPLLKLDGYTITHFTPCDKVRAISKRLGFSEISTQLKILLPLSTPHGFQDAESRLLSHDDPTSEERLTDLDKKIHLDHLPYGCGHLLMTDGDRYCYLLTTRVVRHRLPYVHIHYISDRELFAAHEPLIRASLLKRHQVRFVALDRRLVEDISFKRSFNFWAPANGLYKSANLAPHQIDNLYSDVAFLKLTVLPNMSHELDSRARALWPFRAAKNSAAV